MNLSDRLKKYLYEQGAELVGFADLSFLTNAVFRKGIAVAVSLPVSVVAEIDNGPTHGYFDAYHDLEAKLSEVALSCEDFLNRLGYPAFAQISQRIREDENWCTEIPHKTVATNAGLGWIGKNNLLVTREFGSAIRLVSILTDAPLVCGEPVTQSRCGSCTRCVDACPAQALKGKAWDVHTERDEMVDVHACQKKQVEVTKQCTGIETEFLCGKCFSVCPWTQKWIKSNS